MPSDSPCEDPSLPEGESGEAANLVGMRTKALFLAALIMSAVAMSAAPAVAYVPELSASGFIDREAPCSSLATLAPDNHQVPVVGEWKTKVVLDVAVLLAGVDPDKANEIMAEVAEVYAPLGIELRWVNEAVNFEIDPPPDNSAMGTVLSTSDSRAYIQASKDHFGGARPWWADVVYTMVDGELSSAVAGQADCVGGIAYPESAFAVGEVDQNDPRVLRSAKIAGHEIAHLLAAHHHFANCAQGDPAAILADLTPCTLMFNDVGLISLAFSTLEGAVVRDYALEYANETPTVEPEPEPSEGEMIERTVKLAIDGDRTASGRVATKSAFDTECTREVPVRLERKGGNDWKTVDRAKTGSDTRFRFALGPAGRYRVTAPEHATDYGATCSAATSPTRQAR